LELAIMPRYVYQPITLMLDADAASRSGDDASEIIPATMISADEIGQIMRSRNETLQELRARERELEHAAANLRGKNEMLEAAKRSLEAQDRLVSLGMLSASVAHEMNTPLAVLHGSIEKLLETAPIEPLRGRLQRMKRVTERLRRISESLLGFARARRQEHEPIELRTLVDESWQLVAIDEKAAEVRFENRIAAGEQVLGNADQLTQVFVNLLRNSLNAVASGGHIRALSELRPGDGRSVQAIAIEDDGPGIPPEILPEIFEAFVTTRLDARGTGLGLTVAEGIVSQHGGSISATNCPQGGARLEVVLPAAVEVRT
jgi:two-component system NtrC family sensor kinase